MEVFGILLLLVLVSACRAQRCRWCDGKQTLSGTWCEHCERPI